LASSICTIFCLNGRALEILGFGAEPTIGWQQRFAEALGEPEGIRLFSGYCGDVFGYLPVPEQLEEVATRSIISSCFSE
jgi:hypothetical protein